MSDASYPVLHEDGSSLDWRDASYGVSVNVNEQSATVDHSLSEAPALEALVNSGDAKWALEMRAPKTLFSKLALSETTVCTIDWDPRDVDGDLYLMPGLIAVKATRLSTTGLIDLWGSDEIGVPAGAWLVRADVRSAKSDASSLLTFHVDESMGDGAMRVEPDTGGGQVHFNVWVSAATREQCRHDRNLQVAALIGAFGRMAQIAEPDPESDGREDPLLARIRERLEERGVPAWDDPVQFDPVLAATTLEPLQVEPAMHDEDEL